MSNPPDAASRHAGAVLLITLSAVGICTLLLLAGTALASARLRRAESVRQRAQIRITLADAALDAVRRLAKAAREPADYFEAPWIAARDFHPPQGAAVRVEVVDSARYFDLNNLALETEDGWARTPVMITAALLRACGHPAPEEHAQALQHWVHAQDEDIRREAHYAARVPPDRAPGRPMESLGEWPRVMGFQELLWKDRGSGRERPYLADTFTVIPGARTTLSPININTVPAHVIEAVAGSGLRPEIAALLAAREERPFQTIEEMEGRLGFPPLQRWIPYLGVKSSHYEVWAETQGPGQPGLLWVLTARRQDGSMEILRWVYGSNTRDTL